MPRLYVPLLAPTFRITFRVLISGLALHHVQGLCAFDVPDVNYNRRKTKKRRLNSGHSFPGNALREREGEKKGRGSKRERDIKRNTAWLKEIKGGKMEDRKINK